VAAVLRWRLPESARAASKSSGRTGGSTRGHRCTRARAPLPAWASRRPAMCRPQADRRFMTLTLSSMQAIDQIINSVALQDPPPHVGPGPASAVPDRDFLGRTARAASRPPAQQCFSSLGMRMCPGRRVWHPLQPPPTPRGLAEGPPIRQPNARAGAGERDPPTAPPGSAEGRHDRAESARPRHRPAGSPMYDRLLSAAAAWVPYALAAPSKLAGRVIDAEGSHRPCAACRPARPADGDRVRARRPTACDGWRQALARCARWASEICAQVAIQGLDYLDAPACPNVSTAPTCPNAGTPGQPQAAPCLPHRRCMWGIARSGWKVGFIMFRKRKLCMSKHEADAEPLLDFFHPSPSVSLFFRNSFHHHLGLCNAPALFLLRSIQSRAGPGRLLGCWRFSLMSVRLVFLCHHGRPTHISGSQERTVCCL